MMAMAGAWSLQGFGMFSMIDKAKRALDRPHRPVAAGGLAGHRGRLGRPPVGAGPWLRS
jgi:hypothetical protein